MSSPATTFSSALQSSLSFAPPAAGLPEAASSDSAALLLALSNNTTDAILIKDDEGRMVFANTAALRMLGKSTDAIAGCISRDLYLSACDADMIDAKDQAVMASRIAATTEETVGFHDGARTFESIRIPWLSKHEKIIGVVCISTDITERLRMERMVKTHQTQLAELVEAETADMRALLGHLEADWEEEKSAIARQLHNELGSGLTALNLRLAIMFRQLSDDQQFIDDSVRIKELLNSITQAARRIQAGLHPDKLDIFGIKIALAEQAEEFERRTGISCRIDFPDEELSYPPQINLALFRMAQEALNGIGAHAEATHVDVVLDDTDDNIVLSIRDNGSGMNDCKPPRNMAIEMRTMRERIACLGGAVKVLGKQEKGTDVVVALPKRFRNPALEKGERLNDREWRMRE